MTTYLWHQRTGIFTENTLEPCWEDRRNIICHITYNKFIEISLIRSNISSIVRIPRFQRRYQAPSTDDFHYREVSETYQHRRAMSFPRHVEFLIATTYPYNAASLQEPLNAYFHNVKKRDKTQKSRHVKHLRNTKPALGKLFCLHIHHFKLHICVIIRRGCAPAYKTMSRNL